MKMFQKRIVSLATAIILAAGLAATAKAGELRAGAARVSITPTPDLFPYLSTRDAPFVGVHDDVYARALVLDDGKTRIAVVVEEVEQIFDVKNVLAEVAKAAGVPESNVILSASQTHSSITSYIHGKFTPAALKEIKHDNDGAIEAAKQAAANLQPARLSFGRGAAYVNINIGEAAGYTKKYDPLGPSDKTLDVIRVEGADNKPIAMLINYGMHGGTMFKSVSKNRGSEISGDVPGAVSRILEGAVDGAPVVVYTASADADQVGLFNSPQDAEANLPVADEGAYGWALIDVMARRVAIEVLETQKKMQPSISNTTLKVSTNSVSCPGKVTGVPNASQGGQARPGGQDGPGGAGGPNSPTPQGEAPPVVIPYNAFQINDIALVGIAADLGAEIGQEIRGASQIRNTTIITQAAGSVGYILPDASYVHPGHAIAGSLLKAGCIEKVLPRSIAATLSGNSK